MRATTVCRAVSLLAGVMVSGCGAMQSRDRIGGIASLSLLDDGAVRVVHDDNRAMHMNGPDGKEVSQAVLRRGEYFVLWDGYHVSITYVYLGTENGRALFAEKTWHLPPNVPVKQAEKAEMRIAVKPY